MFTNLKRKSADHFIEVETFDITQVGIHFAIRL
jgi:hypothetical protein